MIFLVEYDRKRGTLVQLIAFRADEAATANSSRLSLELDRMGSEIGHEIVILEAESEDHLRKTHRRYFEQIDTLADPDSPLLAREVARARGTGVTH